jgi:hypothetical protein
MHVIVDYSTRESAAVTGYLHLADLKGEETFPYHRAG